MATYYAWSNFPSAKKKVGDQISQDDIGCDDEEWDYLVSTKVVRKQQYPDIPDSQSPTEHFKNQIAAIEDGSDLNDGDVEEEQVTDEGQKQGGLGGIFK